MSRPEIDVADTDMPLIAETLILCLLAYLIGIGIAWALVRRHRRRQRPYLEQ